MAGRPKTTSAIKLLKGNPGKRPIIDDSSILPIVMPPMPDWLKKHPIAVREWKRECELLFRLGVMTEADVGALAKRCFIESQIQILSVVITQEGYTITTKKGDVKVNPSVSALQRFLIEYRNIGHTFGLDPQGRHSVPTTPKKEDDPFETF